LVLRGDGSNPGAEVGVDVAGRSLHEGMLAAFSDYLGLDERGYNELINEMWI
jgi:hypothetical protein